MTHLIGEKYAHLDKSGLCVASFVYLTSGYIVKNIILKVGVVVPVIFMLCYLTGMMHCNSKLYKQE